MQELLNCTFFYINLKSLENIEASCLEDVCMAVVIFYLVRV